MTRKICDKCKKNFLEDSIQSESREKLDANTRDFLLKTQYQEICPKCLGILDCLVRKTAKHRFREPLKEGLHYTLDGDLFIFSEFYHILRGYCCQSGCIHCPYGFGLDS